MTDKELHSGEDSIVQKQAGKAVQERQTRFRRIWAITSDIAYSCHTEENGRFSIDWMTGTADRVTGYSIEEIKAHGCWRFLVVEEDIALFEKNVTGLAPASHGSCELRIRHKNGGVVWISSFAECVAEPRIPGRLLLYGGLADITERRQAEEKLSASETRYRRLFEAAKDGILILDADTGMIMDVNPFLTGMLGFSRDEFLGKHIWDLGFFKGIVANQANFLELQQKEYIRYENLPLETADGRRINVEFVSNLYPVGQGKVIQCSIRGAHLASFPGQNPYPVLEVGIDGAVRYANPAAMATLERLGLDPDVRQFLSGTPEELVLLRSQCERNPQTQELHLGKASFLRVVAAPPGGDSLHVYLVDITERKQAEDKLRLAQLQWSQFLETSPDPMWIKDALGRYVAASKSYFHIDPSAKGDIIGKTDAECFPPEKAAMYAANDRIAIETGASEGEVAAVGDDGKLRTFLTKKVVLRAPDGSVTGTLGISRDITGRKQAEEETLRERALFDRLVETAPEGIAISDAQGRVMRVNAEFVHMFGYGVDELVGQRIDDLVAPPAFQEEARAITRSTRRGEKTLLETVRCRKDGTLVDVSLIVAPILIAGKLEAGYGIYRDITERKQAEAQLRQSQKMEAIGQLAGGVAHDFNNLLTGILGNIALMRGSLPPTDPLLENLNAAETAARQAADLTKGLLTFSRSAVVLPVPMNIAAALDATLALLKQSLPATMEIVRDYDQTAWNVLMDQSQLTQILLNLAVNARDAMKSQGTLTIRARNEVVGEEYLQTHPFARTGEFVHLSVTDTGPGIPPEILKHLFEPFYTTKPIGSGTGLGLSVVYGAVKQAGGWITAVSTEGVGRTAPQKHPSEAPLGLGEHPRGDWENILGGIGQTCSGATFDIYLPRCLEEPRQSFAPASIPVNVGSGTVLVVEDEPVVRTVTQALLSRSGYTVLTAPDGASALNVLQDHPVGIGLILLDMTMPGMTTGEVVRAIRALDPTVPILLSSGYTSNGAIRYMLEEGSVQGFLGKPYDLDQLLGKVQELLHRS
jgi:two-component system, cell cycle sensor histidine kinase and response regulator CckA